MAMTAPTLQMLINIQGPFTTTMHEIQLTYLRQRIQLQASSKQRQKYKGKMSDAPNPRHQTLNRELMMMMRERERGDICCGHFRKVTKECSETASARRTYPSSTEVALLRYVGQSLMQHVGRKNPRHIFSAQLGSVKHLKSQYLDYKYLPRTQQAGGICKIHAIILHFHTTANPIACICSCARLL